MFSAADGGRMRAACDAGCFIVHADVNAGAFDLCSQPPLLFSLLPHLSQL